MNDAFKFAGTVAVTMAVAGGLLAGAGPAMAHHSAAMFDFTKSLTLTAPSRKYAGPIRTSPSWSMPRPMGPINRRSGSSR